ncbi:hypothetical protein G7Y89_g6534 [Cudoniella acicularis]|uniref:Beta-mannosidase B n=1 Tax=Cudoniella acicularis TaxID=354080 RepID=A0A8H4RNP1_9HELO|nr:hypothetical protein G7Y89_g6534 [Cudoniella acicularis]
MRITRASNIKSRTGCRTCKRRRVKCDETKPCCIRCLSGNRICEGYGIAIDSPKRPTYENLDFKRYPEHEESLANIQPKPMTGLKTIPFLNRSESITFELFRSQTALEMAGVRSSGFWQNVVLPACYSEPAILHASMALAHASRWRQVTRYKSGLGTGDDGMKLNVVNDYNKAIQHLKAHVSGDGNPSSLRVTLIACVIFIALELSTGRFEQATIHLNEGRKLLHSSTQFFTSTPGNPEDETKTLLLASKPQSIEDELVGVFADLDLQSTYFGSERPQLNLSAHKPIESIHPQPLFSFVLPTDFCSIQEASQYLVILTNECLQFVGQKLEFSCHTLQNKIPNVHRQYLYTSLKNWRKTYDRFCLKTSFAEKIDRAWKRRSALMHIQHTWLSVVVPTSYFEVEETDFDPYLKEFAIITDLASSILLEQGMPPGRFSLEFGLVPPLSWAILKCRHPQIRRKALHLMKRAGREGLWEPKLISQLGREYTMLEEGIEELNSPRLLHGESSAETAQEEDWRQLVPLERRISTATAFFETGDYSTLHMKFRRKVWNSDGKFIGTEDIVRSQPYEALQTLMAELSKDWQFRQTTDLNNGTASSFLSVSQFPTVAHLDLLYHGHIKDPYIDTNELDCLWVNDADWEYKTTFPHAPLTPAEHAEIIFEGLDTICSVFLNGELILEARNMHIEHRVDVTSFLKEENVLELKFKNAPEFAKKEMQRIGYKGNGTDVHFGGPERLFVRKAQYHWGWDWGPAINTCGPWKPIWLETWSEDKGRIKEWMIRQEVSEDLKTAGLKITAKIESGNGILLLIEIKDPKGELVSFKTFFVNQKGDFSTTISVPNPELWYPFTYGGQPLYTITCRLPLGNSKTLKLGFRRLRLLQHPLKKEPGTSFTFEINRISIFAGGSCWIPGDYLLPRMTTQRYKDWLSLAKSGNQAMIRVWGGGLVESEDFYSICDELGILVWQDFLYACGDYPAEKEFVKEVKQEAEQQIKRVGHHCSLVIWAGNNEDYMLAERWGWEYDPNDDNEENWAKTNFPARLIYERVLPEICERLAGDVPYWCSSPYGGKTSNDTTIGDTHIWNVWHGKMSPYQSYKAYTSRFVSEFGFESAPSLRTLHEAITSPSERHWQSLTFDAHDKGPGHQRRYGMYSGENFRFQFNPLSSFIYCSQFLQAEAMKYAYNHWRREFRGPGEENCSGILVWQLNDIWPGTSWALVDVNGGRKASFYITKRALAKVVVGMERVVTGAYGNYMTSWSFPEKKEKVELWAVNGHITPLDVILKLKAFDIASGEEVALPEEEKERTLSLDSNRTTEITKLDIPNADGTVAVAYIDDAKTGERLARWVDWPEPMKFVKFHPKLEVTTLIQSEGDDETIILKTNAPVKGVVLQIPIEERGSDAVFSDNFVDLVPGEEISVTVVGGLGGRKVEIHAGVQQKQEILQFAANTYAALISTPLKESSHVPRRSLP